jgi:hypothetical protein
VIPDKHRLDNAEEGSDKKEGLFFAQRREVVF